MFPHRIAHAAAVALAIAAAAAPAASARPIDEPPGWTPPAGFETPETRDSPAAPPRDLRHADTRDYADGRGTYNAPEVVVVKAPQPVAQPTSGGIHWEDVGLGAGGLLGVGLIALAGGAVIVQRRSSRQLA